MLAGSRGHPQTRALSATGPSGDRAIAVIGRPTSPRFDDPLPWEELAGCAAAYFTGRDPLTLAHARRARALVVTARRLEVLRTSGVRADVVVGSASDPSEAVSPADLPVAAGRHRLDRGRARRALPARGRQRGALGGGRSRRARRSTATAAATASRPGSRWGWRAGWRWRRRWRSAARCGAAALTGRGGLVPQLKERA